MLGGGTIHPNRLYSKRGGRQIAAPTGVIPFTCTGSIRSVPGTAHRPFPTVSLMGGSIQPHGLYSRRGGRLIAAPTGVVPFIRTGYICNAPGTARRPFPTYFNGRGEMNNVGCPNNCQWSICFWIDGGQTSGDLPFAGDGPEGGGQGQDQGHGGGHEAVGEGRLAAVALDVVFHVPGCG